MDTFKDDPLVRAVTAYVKNYMSNYDASHDWSHIERVVGLSHYIYAKSANKDSLDLRTIHLAALLHDVGDKKYLKESEDPTTLIATLLTSFSCPAPLASKIQTICLNVSYSTETKNPANPGFINSLIEQHPELAVVQDADRLDAVGAVGLGRMFTFGGAKTGRDMAGSMEHVDEKLVRLVDLAKTDVGRELMKERTERLRVFQGWWEEEVGFVRRVGEGRRG